MRDRAEPELPDAQVRGDVAAAARLDPFDVRVIRLRAGRPGRTLPLTPPTHGGILALGVRTHGGILALGVRACVACWRCGELEKL